MTDGLEIGGGAVDPGGAGARRPPALSASRASDFRRCPLVYRLRAIDRIPEPRTLAPGLGTLVHAALEDLYALEQPERSPERAAGLVGSAVETFLLEPGAAEVVSPDDRPAFRSEAAALVAALYSVEDPRRFSPAACEQFLSTSTGAGTPLRGYLDRVDVAPTGEVRVVDYKTGRPPRPGYESQALFQMRFYALMYQRIHGVVPTQLKLIYLRDGSWLTMTPDTAGLDATEAELDALWTAVVTAGATGNFPPRTSRLCDWCSFRALCPAFGGTPPDYPGWPGSAGDTVVPVDAS